MKLPAIIYCFIPWIVYAIYFMSGIFVSVDVISSFYPVLWLAMSPMVTGLGLFVAYREGCRSKD